MATATAPGPAPAAAPADSMLRFASGARLRQHGQFYNEARTFTAATQVFPEAPIPPGDWLTDVLITVNCVTAGNAATVAFAADAPWSAISEIRFLDPAGNAIYSLTGYGWFLVNLLGGYAFNTDPTDSPLYITPVVGAGATGGSFRFALHVPVAIIDRDGIGAIPNGQSNAVCRVQITLAASTAVYTTPPTNAGTVTITMHESGLVTPSAESIAGNRYATEPPGAGTLQQWSQIPYDLPNGQGIRRDHPRRGQVYRTLIVVARTAAGVRSDTILSRLKFSVDEIFSANGSWLEHRHFTWQRQNLLLTKLPTGVAQISYAHEWDGKVGGELRDLWVPTQPGTSVYFEVDTTAAAVLEVLTNEVVPGAKGPESVLRV